MKWLRISLMTISSYKFGILAEYCAIIILALKGYKILRRRYRNYLGEIDIITRKNNILVFVEVKARMKLEQEYTPVTDKQVRRIRNAAELFIAQNRKYQTYNIRFDLIMIAGNHWPQHLKNIW